MGKGYRSGRIGVEIQKTISSILMNGIKDPRLSSMISISEVNVTRDGSIATCYVTVLNMEKDENAKREKEQDVLAGLNSAKGLFKKEIGKEMKLHHVPDLVFKMDHSLEYGNHIESVINSLGIDKYQHDTEVDEDDF